MEKYDKTNIVAYANCYYALLSTANVLRGGNNLCRCDVELDNLPKLRQDVKDYASIIPTELGDMWIERPRNLEEECLREIEKLEQKRTSE